MKRQFQDRDGISGAKIALLPIGADTSVRPEDVDGDAVRQRLGLGDRPTLIYFGAMERVRHLEFLLRVMQKVKGKAPNAKLLMVGGSTESSADVEWLKNEAAGLGIAQDVIFTGWVPREEVPHYIVASDLGVSVMVPLSAMLPSLPTKLVETMAMARPVVGNDIPAQQRIIEESKCGLCVAYQEDAFAGAIIWLLNHPAESRIMGQRGRAYIEQHLAYASLGRQVLNEYAGLLGSRSRKRRR
jgi:glycosyltransferase involved in cell wall biosynthesis